MAHTSTNASARIHGNRRITSADPQSNPGNKRRSVATVHQNHRRNLCFSIRLWDPAVSKHARGVAFPWQTLVKNGFHIIGAVLWIIKHFWRDEKRFDIPGNGVDSTAKGRAPRAMKSVFPQSHSVFSVFPVVDMPKYFITLLSYIFIDQSQKIRVSTMDGCDFLSPH